jgi:hypothetical protein
MLKPNGTANTTSASTVPLLEHTSENTIRCSAVEGLAWETTKSRGGRLGESDR